MERLVGKVINSATGGITGFSGEGTGTIISNNNSQVENNVHVSNCTNNGTILGIIYVGGICGGATAGTIDSCTNTGNITASTSIAGGIAGKSDVDITNCKNTGNITTNGNPNPSNFDETQGTGGIAGRSTANISFSSNEGNITSNGCVTGGIIGCGSENTVVDQCYNKGSVEAKEKNSRWNSGISSKENIQLL